MANYIAGVYNYCDRWCERCPFIERCRVYAMEKEFEEKHPDKKDDFGVQLAYNLENALKMIYEHAAKEGIDLDSIEDEEETKDPKIEDLKEHAKILTNQYENLAEAWLKGKETLIEYQLQEWKKLLEIGVNKIIPKVKDVQNALEVIRWYFFFIRAKISRAYSQMHDKWILKEFPIQNDMNGSAKIAFIAIENSLAAWEIMRTHFEEETDNILDIMLALSRIRKDIEIHFPNINQFIRPGFDE